MDNLLNNVGADVTATYERIVAIDAEVKSKQDQIRVSDSFGCFAAAFGSLLWL